MTDCQRATVPIDDLGIDVPRSMRQRLGGKRLVEFDRVDIGPGDPGAVESAVGGVNRGVPKVLRFAGAGALPAILAIGSMPRSGAA